MAVATVLEFPGMTREHYERGGASLVASDPPAGIRYHACAPVAGGRRIMDIWDSPDPFARFVDGVYLPSARRCGVAAPSRREALPTYHAGPVAR